MSSRSLECNEDGGWKKRCSRSGDSMKRIWRISQISHLLCLSRGSSSTLKTLTPFCFILFRSPIYPPFHRSRPNGDILIREASGLKNDLLRCCKDSDKVACVLEGKKRLLTQGAAFVELLRQLCPWPLLSQVVMICLSFPIFTAQASVSKADFIRE